VNELSAVAAIATRDFLKFLRDPGRLVLSFLVPFLLMVLLATTLQLNLGRAAGLNFVGFTFTGVLGLTTFQSSMQGIASLLDDRQSDFAQEVFVAPISRYAIVFGKIAGETLVAMAQTVPLVALALALRVSVTPGRLALMAPVVLGSCLLGGSVGLIALSLINSRQAADQIFNFLLLPQLFLAGVFNPIKTMPWYFDVLSRLSPLRYVVDLLRDVMYTGRPEYTRVVLLGPLPNLATMAAMFVTFMLLGTTLFVRRETNR
jgi:ABC-2 type transport system permease protein